MNWIVQFCSTELVQVEGNQASELVGWAAGEYGAGMEITGVCCDPDAVVARLLVVDCCQAVAGQDELLDHIKHMLVLWAP